MAEGAFQDPNAWKTQEFRQKIIAKLYVLYTVTLTNFNMVIAPKMSYNPWNEWRWGSM